MKVLMMIGVICGLTSTVYCTCNKASVTSCDNTFNAAIKAASNATKGCTDLTTYITCLGTTGCNNNLGVKKAIAMTKTDLNKFGCCSTPSIFCTCDRSTGAKCDNAFKAALKVISNDKSKGCTDMTTFLTCIGAAGCSKDSRFINAVSQTHMDLFKLGCCTTPTGYCKCDQAAATTCDTSFQAASKVAGNNKTKGCTDINTFLTCLGTTGCGNNVKIKTATMKTKAELYKIGCCSTPSLFCDCDRTTAIQCDNTFQAALKNAGNDKSKACSVINTFLTCLGKTGCSKNAEIQSAVAMSRKEMDKLSCCATHAEYCDCDHDAAYRCDVTFQAKLKTAGNDTTKGCKIIKTFLTCLGNSGCSNDAGIKKVIASSTNEMIKIGCTGFKGAGGASSVTVSVCTSVIIVIGFLFK